MRDSRLLDADSNGLETCFEFNDSPTTPKERMIQDGARNRKLSDVVLERHREVKMLEHLEDLIDYIGFLREGRTSMVLVTEGWRLPPPDPALLKEIEQTGRDGPPSIATGSGRLAMFDSLAEGHRAACILHGQRLAREDLAARYRRLIQRANGRNVSFIPVNPFGLVTHDSPISQSRSRPLDVTDPSMSE